jgi:hypothetical protein
MTFPESFPDAFANLVARLAHCDPDQRPDLPECLSVLQRLKESIK